MSCPLSDKKTVQFSEEVEVKTVEAFPQVVEIDEVSKLFLLLHRVSACNTLAILFLAFLAFLHTHSPFYILLSSQKSISTAACATLDSSVFSGFMPFSKFFISYP